MAQGDTIVDDRVVALLPARARALAFLLNREAPLPGFGFGCAWMEEEEEDEEQRTPTLQGDSPHHRLFFVHTIEECCKHLPNSRPYPRKRPKGGRCFCDFYYLIARIQQPQLSSQK